MTGKEAIFEYLKTHKTFCSADVSDFSGVSHTGINQAASDLARKGLLVVDGKVWRTVYYRMVTEDEKEWEAYVAMSGCQQAAHRAKLCWVAMVAAIPKY